MILGALLDFLEPLCFQNKPFQRFSALSVGEYTQREDSSNAQLVTFTPEALLEAEKAAAEAKV